MRLGLLVCNRWMLYSQKCNSLGTYNYTVEVECRNIPCLCVLHVISYCFPWFELASKLREARAGSAGA